MTTSARFEGLDRAGLPARPLHLAIGIFDGVHLGHRAVLESAVQSARRSSGVSAVLTFSPHPSVLFNPQNPVRMILDMRSKIRMLGSIGVEAVIVQPFDAAFAAVTAEEFVPMLKRKLPYLASVYVGQNWRFGRGRKGDVAFLVEEGRRLGVGVYDAPRVSFDGGPISSTAIRACLQSGDMGGAAARLGYTYFAEGSIVHGKHLGRTIGFPTLNLAWAPDLRPRFGVYAVRVSGGKSVDPLPAVANYGLRPTVESTEEPRLEVHVLAPCSYHDGDSITVEWVRFIRPEMKFAGLDELKAQIALDAATARAEFSLP